MGERTDINMSPEMSLSSLITLPSGEFAFGKPEHTSSIVVRNWLPEDAPAISRVEKKCWPEWLRTPENILRQYASLPQGQLLIPGENGEVLASLTTNRIQLNWEGNIVGKLRNLSWDNVAGGRVDSGNYQRTYVADGNTAVLMSMNVDPDHRGHSLAPTIVEHLKQTAKQLGISHLISPFRPMDYGTKRLEEYDKTGELLGFEEYCQMVDPAKQGLPIDPWLRSLARSGMKPLVVVQNSMMVDVSRSEFEHYQVSHHPESWREVNAGTWICNEVGQWNVMGDRAVYVEPNIWGEVPIEIAVDGTSLTNPQIAETRINKGRRPKAA